MNTYVTPSVVIDTLAVKIDELESNREYSDYYHSIDNIKEQGEIAFRNEVNNH